MFSFGTESYQRRLCWINHLQTLLTEPGNAEQQLQTEPGSSHSRAEDVPSQPGASCLLLSAWMSLRSRAQEGTAALWAAPALAAQKLFLFCSKLVHKVKPDPR